MAKARISKRLGADANRVQAVGYLLHDDARIVCARPECRAQSTGAAQFARLVDRATQFFQFEPFLVRLHLIGHDVQARAR